MAGTSILQIILRVTKEGTGERQAAKEAKELKGTLGELGLGSLASASALGILSGAVIAAGNYLREGAIKAEEGNKVLAKQEAILKATGYAAGLNARELDVMAMSLAKLSGMDDDVIRDAQSMLLTFREIGGEGMPRAAQAVLDLSTTFGGVSQSATQVGKALNEPLKGMTALAKSGVTFSDVQKEMAKNFLEMGDIASAQDIILREIEAQVGGTAAAMEQASNGSGRLQVAWDELQVQLSMGLLPLLRAWNDALTENLWAMAEATKESRQAKTVMDMMLAKYPEWQRALMNNSFYYAANREQIELYTNQLNRGSEMTDYATALYKGMGGSISELMGYTNDYTDSLASSEEAMKAITQANEDYLKGVESMQSLEDSHAESVRKNAEERAKIEQEKAEYIARYGEWNVAELAKFDAALDANGAKALEIAEKHEQATNEIILDYVRQKMMADGVLDDKEMQWLLAKGVEWGIYSETAIAKLQEVQAEANRYMDVLNSIPPVINTEVLMKVQQQGYDYQMLAYGYGYASGTDGWETVPEGHPNDSYPVFLTSGEKFAVIPAGQSPDTYGSSGGGFGGGGAQRVIVEFAGDAQKLLRPMVEEIMRTRR